MYIRRLHDEMLVGLYRAMRRGNFLLLGRSGDGKTAALMQFSDLLINSGQEFSMIPSFTRRSDRGFVPPFAKINLIDDFEPERSSELIPLLEKTRTSSLNIVAANRVEGDIALKAVAFDGVIEIRTLSLDETSFAVSEWQRANGVEEGLEKSRSFLEALHREGRNLREIKFLLNKLKQHSVTILRSDSSAERVQRIKPRIITLNKRLTDAVRDNSLNLDDLSPEQFEEFVAELFDDQGYRVTLTKKSRDGGIDVIAEKADIVGISVLVQCKKYAAHRAIGAQVIREMTGVLDINRATAGAIFTTSRFSPTAVKEAKVVKHRLSLLDYFDILMCLNNSGHFS